MLTTVEKQIATLLQYDPAYEWRGGNKDLINSMDSEVIAAGPSETGKTWAACYKAHMACREYPQAQGALVRKVAASIPGTVLVTMKRVIGNFPVIYFGGEHNPERIIYPNGSQIWIGGMDNPTKVLSGERDFIQVCQAEELQDNDWEIMTTRTTGRGSVMPYTQVFGDCNPAGSMHWIRQRNKAGALKLLHTVHSDNPSLYLSDGVLTAQGLRTLATLDNLTGIRRKRLRDGIWATAEGAVYDNFDVSIHVKVRQREEFHTFYLAMDEGYTNPAVILLVGEDSDGRRHVMKEWYERGKLQSAVVQQAKEWTLEYNIHLAAVDESAAGLIADLRNEGVPAQGAKGRVLDGIQLMQDRLKVQGDGLPRETIDPACVNHINEYESYVWKKTPTSGIAKDEPEKKDDHSMDARRYLEVCKDNTWVSFG
jgi:PBSX family phage terminase large subunit